MSIAQTADVAMLETREASPSHFLMRIESYSLLSKNGIHKYESGEFAAGGYKWRLILYPNEDKSGIDSKYVSVYLALSDTKSLLQPANSEVNAVFSIFLLNQISGNYQYSSARTRRFIAMKLEIWGISKFISKKNLMDPSNGFVMDDNCVFGAEVFIVEKAALSSECLSVKNVIGGPYKRDWRISKFSKLGEVWTSEEFVAGGVYWNVEVWPKGNGDGEGRYLSAFLCLVDDDSKRRVNASFSIYIRDQINNIAKKLTQHSRWFSPIPGLDAWGRAQFVELATLEDPKYGFIINDRCLLEIKIFVQAVV